MEQSRIDDIHRTLVANGFDRDRGYTRGYRYCGEFAVSGRYIRAALTFDTLEFTQLPALTLLDPAQDCPEVVAHLAKNNEFCYAQKEEVVLDRYNVGGSILACMQLAQAGLERAITRKDQSSEIAREFPQHWLPDSRTLFDYRKQTSGSAWLCAIPRSRQNQLLILIDHEKALEVFGLDSGTAEILRKERQPAYVHLTNKTLTFAGTTRPPKTFAEFLIWAEGIELGLSEILLAQVAAHYPRLSSLFVSAPNGCVGIAISLPFSAEKLQRRQGLTTYLRAHQASLIVDRIECSRMDPDFILSRNLARPSPFVGKRIALVGCGTIGSHLAKMLVQSGAGWNGGSLVLIDKEVLVPGNIGRHFLGARHLEENKAEALRHELLQVFPEHTIIALPTDVITQLPRLADVDLVIDATGEEALSRSINEAFVSQRRNRPAPAVIHVWLVGNGDAAQALLVESQDHACYKCLRVGHDGQWRFSPLLSSRTPQLTFGPCGEGMFMAYGVGAPVIAAGLGLQIALDWASGDGKPYFRTICIDTRTTHPVRNQNASRLKGCPACEATD